MDAYRKKLIGIVRNYPLLWDPTIKEYKNRDLRQQAWREIDCMLQPPPGTTATAKATWDQLSRCHCNALRRQEKRAKSKTANSSTKEWRFKQDLKFLIPIKQIRRTTSGIGTTDLVLQCDEESDVSFGDPPMEPSPRDSGGEDVDEDIVREDRVQPKRRKFIAKEEDRGDDEEELFELLRQRQLEKKDDSARLNFFKSIMPKVDVLTDDEFVDFQVEVLQILQRRRAPPIPSVYHLSNYKRPSTTPDPHSSRSSFE